jgi:hypothetical protein
MDEWITSLLIFIPVALSAFMLYLAASQERMKRTERREHEFKILQDMILKERHIYSEKAMELYRSEYKESTDICKRMAGNNNKWDCHLISRYDWTVESSSRSFTPLKDLKISYDPNIWDTGKNIEIRNKYATGKNSAKLPLNNLSFTENVKALTGRYIMSELTYGLSKVSTKDGISLEVYLGRYSDFFDTCGYITYETAHLLHYGKRIDDLKLNDFPYRSKMDPFVLKNRFANIRICTLTILKNFENSDKVVFLIHRGPSFSGERGEDFNVIPAGSYKPIFIENVSDPDIDGTKKINIDPHNTIVRELLEQAVDNFAYEKLSSKKILLQKRKEIYADVFLLGVGIEPLNLRTELMTIMVVDVGMSPIFGTIKDLDGFKDNVMRIFEGSVVVKEFTIPNLEQFSDNLTAIPACREILEFATDRFEDLKALKVSNNLNS